MCLALSPKSYRPAAVREHSAPGPRGRQTLEPPSTAGMWGGSILAPAIPSKANAARFDARGEPSDSGRSEPTARAGPVLVPSIICSTAPVGYL